MSTMSNVSSHEYWMRKLDREFISNSFPYDFKNNLEFNKKEIIGFSLKDSDWNDLNKISNNSEQNLYILLEEEPDDWDTNWFSYFIKEVKINKYRKVKLPAYITLEYFDDGSGRDTQTFPAGSHKCRPVCCLLRQRGQTSCGSIRSRHAHTCG